MILQSEISNARMLTSIVSKFITKMFLRVSISLQKRSLTKQAKNRIDRRQTAVNTHVLCVFSVYAYYDDDDGDLVFLQKQSEE